MSRQGKGLLYVISYHHACNDGTLMALVALLPILVEEMSLTFSEIGLLGFGLIITVFFQLIVGKAADKMVSKYLLEVGAALMAASFLLILMVDDFVGLFLVVISMRLGASFYHPVGISWITKEYAGPRLESALGVQSGIGNFGVIAALATSGYLGEGFGWKAPCVLWASLNVIAIVLGVLSIRNIEYDRDDSSEKHPFSLKQTMRKIAMLILPISAGGALYQVTSYFGPVNLTTMHGWSAGDADLVFAVWIGVGTLTSYFFGRLSARYGRQAILAWGFLVSAAASLVLFLTSDWYFVIPSLVAFGAMLFVTYPALFSAVTERTEVGERGTAFGMVFGFQLGGGAVLVYLSGIAADAAGNPAVSFLLVAALSTASLAALGLPESVRKPKWQPEGGR